MLFYLLFGMLFGITIIAIICLTISSTWFFIEYIMHHISVFSDDELGWHIAAEEVKEDELFSLSAAIDIIRAEASRFGGNIALEKALEILTEIQKPH